jgi:hypothetical protein
MNALPSGLLRTVSMTVVRSRAGTDSDSEALVRAARSAHDDLAGVLVPLIGDLGLKALSARALHLTKRDYPLDNLVEGNGEMSEALGEWLEQLDAERVAEAGPAMLTALGGLLNTFIGEGLTLRLLRKAWPEGFSDSATEETRAHD